MERKKERKKVKKWFVVMAKCEGEFPAFYWNHKFFTELQTFARRELLCWCRVSDKEVDLFKAFAIVEVFRLITFFCGAINEGKACENSQSRNGWRVGWVNFTTVHPAAASKASGKCSQITIAQVEIQNLERCKWIVWIIDCGMMASSWNSEKSFSFSLQNSFTFMTDKLGGENCKLLASFIFLWSVCN